MPAGVCFKGERRAFFQDQWSFVFSNFGIKDIWELKTPNAEKIYQPTIKIESAEELPARPLVVMAPPDGRYIKGTESLIDFVHPDDAIYLFGGSYDNLSNQELGDRKPDHLVYIPFEEYECYAFTAAYVTLWDRKMKHG